MLFSDRNVYRPGEELHLEPLVREWGEQGLSVPDRSDRHAGLRGRAWAPVLPDQRRVQPIGRLVGHNPAADRRRAGPTRPGFIWAPMIMPTPSECRTSNPTPSRSRCSPSPPLAADESIAVPVSARYLFGKTLSCAQVKWWLEAEDTEFKPEGFDSFRFGRVDSEFRHGRGGLSTALNGQGMLGGSSNFVIAADLPINNAAPQPRLASLLVEVTDLNQQTLSRRVEFVRHSSDFYLGLRQGAEVLQAGQALPLEVAAVRADGQPWPETVKAHLTLQRIDWHPVRIQGAGRTFAIATKPSSPMCLKARSKCSRSNCQPGPHSEISGNRIPGLPTLPAGHYLVEVKAKDPGGRTVVSSLDFDVSAPAAIGWNYRNDVQLTLKPDRKSYAPGDAAEILVEAPFSGTAYVSVERDKVLRSFTTRLEGNAPSIRVPLEPGDVPNVFVSVTLVRGADECPRKIKEPDTVIGSCELAVADPQTRLAVTVTPGTTNYLPAQPVEVTVQVADAAANRYPGPRWCSTRWMTESCT